MSSDSLFRFRPGTRRDFSPCLDLLWPGDATAALGRTLASLWDRCFDHGTFVVAEMVTDAGQAEPCGFWLSAFVSREFADRARQDPRPHPALEFYEALMAGQPLLTELEIAQAHAQDGVDVLVLHCGSRFVDFRDPRTAAVLAALSAGFFFTHAGYRLRSIRLETYGAAAAAFAAAGQFRLCRDFDATDPARVTHIDPACRPCLFALTRDDVRPGALNPLVDLFFTPPPRLGFAQVERRTLTLALGGASDAAIAAAQGVSEHTVKKTWRRIFAKAARSLPYSRSRGEAEGSRRGKERRCLVLEYVRQHPEELRPYSSSRSR